MAAGQGFKTFATGEVLTAGDVNGYLMQGVLVFASAAARNAAITSPQEGQFAFTKDTNGLWYYDGAAWVASGATGDIEGVTAGVGISGGGTSGTVTVTNSMATAITAAGDLIKGTGSGTFNVLPIGTTGQILTVAGGTATWATTSSSAGSVLIKRASFSNVTDTSTTFDDMFSSTYGAYQIVIETLYSNTDQTNDLQMQWRYAGPNTQTSSYNGNNQSTVYNSTTITSTANNGGSSMLVSLDCGGSSFPGSGSMLVTNAFGSSGCPKILGSYAELDAGRGCTFWQATTIARTYTGFLLKASATNITGTVAVYGLAK